MESHNLAKLIGRPVELQPVPFTGRYPQTVLIREVVKGAAGLAICLGVLLALDPSPYIAWPLGIIAFLFGLYLYQQLSRYPLRLEVHDSGVTKVLGHRRQQLPWRELKNLRLAYYPNGRKASSGTLVMTLSDGSHRLKVDSSLDEFPTLLHQAALAARERNLALHPTTEANLNQLGL